MGKMRKWWAPSAGFCFYGLKWLLFTLCLMRRKSLQALGAFCLLSRSFQAAVERQCVEVTNCSDRIPFYNITLGNKMPLRAVCQLSILRAVGAPLTEIEKYVDGQTNNNTKLMAERFFQMVSWCKLFCWRTRICGCSCDHMKEKWGGDL